MKYVKISVVSPQTHDFVECGRIYLLSDRLEAIPNNKHILGVLGHPIGIEDEDGNMKVIHANEPESFLEGLCHFYHSPYFCASKVLEDDRPLSEIRTGIHPS